MRFSSSYEANRCPAVRPAALNDTGLRIAKSSGSGCQVLRLVPIEEGGDQHTAAALVP